VRVAADVELQQHNSQEAGARVAAAAAGGGGAAGLRHIPQQEPLPQQQQPGAIPPARLARMSYEVCWSCKGVCAEQWWVAGLWLLPVMLPDAVLLLSLA
jgi:hypothetical protein